MKNNLAIFVTYISMNVILINSALCQHDTVFRPDKNEEIFYLNSKSSDQVKDIEKLVHDIKINLTKYQKIEKQKDASGYKYIYTNGKDIQVITVFYIDKNINKKVDWYFSKNILFYCEQYWTNIETNKIVDFEKFYLNNEQLFAWYKLENILVDDKSNEFKNFAKELIIYASKLKTELNK